MNTAGSGHDLQEPISPAPGPGTWHDKPLDAVLTALGTSSGQGLSEAAAAVRLRETGPNALQKGETISPWRIFANQFGSLVIWVLIGAGVVSTVLGEFTDGIAIIAIVVLNAALGFFQEYRAEQAAAALARLTAPRARVVRDGTARQIDATEVVPGDILLIEAGDLIAADSRLIEAASLRANEASLTGESAPVEKRVGTRPPQTALADRTNMIFLVSSITGGSGRAVVTATGMETEVGRISSLLATATRGQTPLQKRIDVVGRKLLYLSFGVVSVVFLLGLLRSMPAFELFLTAVSLAVAAIPEGLPAVITIALALGMQRMARRNALVRRLAAVETLGCAQVICTDKTGTLTVGEMTARRLVTGERDFTVTGEGYQTAGTFLSNGSECVPTSDPTLLELLNAGAACNDAEISSTHDRTSIVGDPTEGALLVAAAKANISRAGIEESMPKLYAIPFDSDRKRMTVIRRRENEPWAFVKGAPEVILERCATVHTSRGVEPLTQEMSDRFVTVQGQMAQTALRILAVAERPLPGFRDPADGEPNQVDIERDLTLVGLVGLQDPPRAEARDAVARCRRAGIRTVMITGDHRETGRAIARELGIISAQSDDQGQAMAGSDLDTINDEELRGRVPSVAVYARVTAEHKLRIVRAWKALGAVVAMTGDGVNDAPALKEASIGIAMGITGTEVTKQAADIIITDDNFASIVAAVEEGRGIYDNVAKTLAYLLAGNCGELFVMLFAAIVGWPLPLLPIQLLWINLVTDGLPALALATDPVDQDVLARAPRRPDAELMDKAFVWRTVLTGTLTATVALIAFAYEFFADRDVAQARNAAFSALVIAELLRSFGARSDTRTVFETGLLSNMRLLVVVLASFALQLVIHHTPILGAVFGTQPITWMQCLAWTGLGTLPLGVMEIRKVFLRKRAQADQPNGGGR